MCMICTQCAFYADILEAMPLLNRLLSRYASVHLISLHFLPFTANLILNFEENPRILDEIVNLVVAVLYPKNFVVVTSSDRGDLAEFSANMVSWGVKHLVT